MLQERAGIYDMLIRESVALHELSQSSWGLQAFYYELIIVMFLSFLLFMKNFADLECLNVICRFLCLEKNKKDSQYSLFLK